MVLRTIISAIRLLHVLSLYTYLFTVDSLMLPVYLINALLRGTIEL